MVSKKACCITGGVVVVVIGAALVVIGALLNMVVSDQIDKAVKSALELETSDQTSDDWTDFINTDLTFTYWFFNYTNAFNFEFAGERPTITEVGPFIYKEFSVKYNTSFNLVDGTFNYNQWWQKVPQSTGLNASTSVVTIPHPLYGGVLGTVLATIKARAGFGTTAGLLPNPGNLSQLLAPSENLLFAGQLPAVLRQVRDGVLTSFPLQASLLATGQYINATLTAIAGLVPEPASYQQWGNLGPLSNQSLFNVSGNAELLGFEVCSPNTLSNCVTAATADRVMNVSATASLRSTAGLTLWAASLDTSNPTQALAAQGALIADLGGNAADYAKIAGWLAETSSDPTSVKNVNLRTSLGVSTQREVGGLQFATGLVAGRSIDPTLTNPASAALVSLGYRGFEWFNSTFFPSDLSVTPSTVTSFHSITAAQAVALLDLFSGNATVCNGTTLLEDFLSRGQSNPVVPTDTENCTISANYTAMGISDANKAFYTAYLLGYLGPYLIYGGTFLAGNAGLFQTRTVHDFLVGFTASIAGSPTPVTGFFSSYTSEAQHWAQTQQGAYSIFTGARTTLNPRGIDWVRRYYRYRGVAQFRTLEDLAPISPISPSYTAAACGFIFTGVISFNRRCQPFDTSVIITGSSTSSSQGPFQEDNPLPGFGIFLLEALRVANFSLIGEVSFKDIKMNRYNLVRSQLQNNTRNPDNAIWRHTFADGVVPTADFNGGLPVVLSQPFFGAIGLDQTLDKITITNLRTFSDDDFGTFVYVEPLSGLTMYGRKRLQASLRVDRALLDSRLHRATFSGLSDFSDRAYYLPMFWGEEAGEIKDDDASDFRRAVYGTRDLSDILTIVFLAVGIVLVVVGIFCIVYQARKAPEGMQSLPSKSAL